MHIIVFLFTLKLIQHLHSTHYHDERGDKQLSRRQFLSSKTQKFPKDTNVNNLIFKADLISTTSDTRHNRILERVNYTRKCGKVLCSILNIYRERRESKETGKRGKEWNSGLRLCCKKLNTSFHSLGFILYIK
jgi:hypothetical protein